MPLVFFVLIVLVIIFNAKDSAVRCARASGSYAKDMRKTNAILEQRIMDDYMKHGLSADEAFKKSYEEIIAAGYEPCIPREAYGENSSWCSKKYKRHFAPEEYDSFLVRDRRKDFREEWCNTHPGEDISPHLEEIEQLVYQNFPTSIISYKADLNRREKRKAAVPIGKCIIYPGIGTCEVLAHNWIGDGSIGYYSLKVIKNGGVIDFVKIGDPRISRQG